jgi:hypothetical protein
VVLWLCSFGLCHTGDDTWLWCACCSHSCTISGCAAGWQCATQLVVGLVDAMFRRLVLQQLLLCLRHIIFLQACTGLAPCCGSAAGRPLHVIQPRPR